MNEVGQRTLGASGIVVPPMGIGIAIWGDKLLGYSKSYTREDCFQAYCESIDAGLNFFDTAEGYGNGESEQLLGEFRQLDGRPILIASKFAPPNLFSPSFSRFSPASLLKAVDASLERLGVDCIDLYQLHYPPNTNKIDVYMDVLAEAVKLGKVRAVGVSNFNASLMWRAYARLDYHGIPLASNQVCYNLLMRYPEFNGVLEACRELDVALIAYTPMANGILHGKFRNREQSVLQLLE